MNLSHLLFAAVLFALAIVAGVLMKRSGYLDGLKPFGDALVTGFGKAKAVFVDSDVDNALRRMWPLWLLFAACFAVVLFQNPMKAGLIAYGIGKISIGGVVGYLVDFCATEKKNRPENLEDGIALGTARKCRTWVICATILAVAIGVP